MCHFRTENLDFENLEKGSPIIGEWYPREQSQYTIGGPPALGTRVTSGGFSNSFDTQRILVGFRYETGVTLPTIVSDLPQPLRQTNGDVAVSAVLEASGGDVATDETSLYFEISENGEFTQNVELLAAEPFRVLGAQSDIPFSLTITGLNDSKTYHVRPVAINEAGILTSSEMPEAKRVLNAAALTYVAAAVTAVLEMIRLILIYRNR
jgi:hypothetical protein